MYTTLINLIREAGACAAGACRVENVDSAEDERLRKWLSEGCNGTMDYLERNAPLCSNPTTLLEGARTILCAAFSYAPTSVVDRSPLFADYARGADYHKVLKKRLKPVCRALEEMVPGSKTRICVDSAPVRERYWAIKAGLGYRGLNGLLIVPGAGSKVFLAEILWTGEVDIPEVGDVQKSCIGCGACVRACPGGALDGAGKVDARRCLSYLTIEYRGPLTGVKSLKKRIYGCDVCQDVCPENRVSATPLDEFTLREGLKGVTLEDLLRLGSDDYDRLTIGSAIRRVSLEQLRRNARLRDEFEAEGCDLYVDDDSDDVV